jgi:DNA modification methylase
MVCEQHSRKYVGVEINPQYVELALQRIKKTQRLLALVGIA